jgi:hypothetical protein
MRLRERIPRFSTVFDSKFVEHVIAIFVNPRRLYLRILVESTTCNTEDLALQVQFTG